MLTAAITGDGSVSFVMFSLHSCQLFQIKIQDKKQHHWATPTLEATRLTYDLCTIVYYDYDYKLA